jgi:hypothetical protein
MSEYAPITITQREIHAFAEAAARFCATLDDAERRMWRTLLLRAGGNDAPLDADGLAAAFASIWEEGVHIAPLYSGAMPETGHVD